MQIMCLEEGARRKIGGFSLIPRLSDPERLYTYFPSIPLHPLPHPKKNRLENNSWSCSEMSWKTLTDTSWQYRKIRRLCVCSETNLDHLDASLVHVVCSWKRRAARIKPVSVGLFGRNLSAWPLPPRRHRVNAYVSWTHNNNNNYHYYVSTFFVLRNGFVTIPSISPFSNWIIYAQPPQATRATVSRALII